MSDSPTSSLNDGSLSDIARSTSVRPLAKLLSLDVPVWVMGGDGRIAYVSASCGQWLRTSPEALLGRGGSLLHGAAESQASGDPHRMDQLARSLMPPVGFSGRSPASRRVHPIAADDSGVLIEPRECLFVPLPGDDGVGVLAIADMTIARDGSPFQPYLQLVETLHRQLAQSPRRSVAAVTLGTSVWAQRLVRQMEIASTSTMHVTFSGPAGSGYESIARVIHSTYGSHHKGSLAPLVCVDGPLMDAELFDVATGHAIAQLLEQETSIAAVLLRDIDQMPHDAQARLELLVSNYPKRFRLFATTALPSVSLAPTLLPSLAARIGDLEMYVAPLSARVEDIPIIAAAMLQRRRWSNEGRAEQLGRDALDRLVMYPWPGNFDELDEAIRNAAKQCRGDTIHVEHLPLAIRTFGAVSRPVEVASRVQRVVLLDELLEETERESIVAALDAVQGNKAAAARHLGVSRPRLLRRIEQLHISWPAE